MNAIDTMTERPNAPTAAPHSTHKFWLLLRREFWENKGGFLWAPLIMGGAYLLLSLIVFTRSDSTTYAEGTKVDLWAFLSELRLQDAQSFREAIDRALSMTAAAPLIAMAFVVFFYCLSALYDERKDRSVFFWKSLPLSDHETVLSKVVSAILIVPMLAVAIAILTMLLFVEMGSTMILVEGHYPGPLLWDVLGRLLVIAGRLVAGIPIYVVWALPTVGWLLLCSAWAKNKPFLWATMIPVFATIFVVWSPRVYGLDPAPAFWKNIASRLLLGTTPGGWSQFGLSQSGEEGWWIRMLIPETHKAFTIDNYRIFTTPQLWIGAVAGAVMIYGAIRIRRWRDEG